MSVKISGVIITFNEEDFIERCLESMKDVVDEIIVIDSYSTDKTKEICEKHKVIFIERKFIGFGEQKNYAVQQATYDYVLCLDADETLSDELKTSILKVKNNWTDDAYLLKFRHFYCGKWLKYGSDNRKIRLFDRRKAKWTNNIVHETVELDQNETVPALNGYILHILYLSYFKHASKIDYYLKSARS